MIKQVLILAAGEGKRMRPLTENLPKPLIKVNGISMLDRILNKLEKIKTIEKIVINGHYLSEKIEKHIKNLNNSKIIFSKETKKLETGGGLLKSMEFFDENEPILIINGDIIWQNFEVINFIIDNFNPENTDILLGLKQKKDFAGYDGNGDFNLKNGQISKENINDFVFTGIEIFHPKILKNITLPDLPFSLNHFFADLSQKIIKIKGIELKGDFFHIGTPESLEKYEKDII